MRTLSLPGRHGLKITGIYLAVSAAWIIFSDRILNNIISDQALLLQVQTYKGLFFVVVTSGLLYYLISQSTTSIEKSRNRMEALLLKNQTLLSELHHRVKNNLAIIAGLIELQTEQMEEAQAAPLRETQFRIYTLADIEEMMYQGEDIGNIPFHRLMEHLVAGLEQTEHTRTVVQAEINEVFLNINQAVPLGLLVNEIFSQFRTNGYAEVAGAIDVRLRYYLPHKVTLVLRFEEVPTNIMTKLMESRHIEATLIDLYTRQLKATTTWRPNLKGGRFKLEFEKSDRPGSSSRMASAM